MTEEIVEKKPVDTAKKQSPKIPKLKYNPADFWFNVGERVNEMQNSENICCLNKLPERFQRILLVVFAVISAFRFIVKNYQYYYINIFLYSIVIIFFLHTSYCIIKSFFKEYKKTNKSCKNILEEVRTFLIASMVSIVLLHISLNPIWILIEEVDNNFYKIFKTEFNMGQIMLYITLIPCVIIVFYTIWRMTISSWMSFVYKEWEFIKLRYRNTPFESLLNKVSTALFSNSMSLVSILTLITIITNDPEAFFINFNISNYFILLLVFLLYSFLLSQAHHVAVKEYRLAMLQKRGDKKQSRRQNEE